MTSPSTNDRLARIEEELGISHTTTMRVSIIQDRSYSMKNRRRAVVSGYNEYIGDLKDNPPEGVKDVFMTLTQFNVVADVVFRNRKLRRVNKLTEESYVPSGGTALYDAIGKTIKTLEEEAGDTDKVLVLIMTDGEENSSTRYTKEQITEMIEEKQEEGNWTFVYIGADLDAMADGGAIGIRRGNTFSFIGTDQGYLNTYSGMSSATRSLASSDSVSTTNFSSLMTPTQSTTTKKKDDDKGN